MKCNVGVHTGRIELQFAENDWEAIKALVDGLEPPRIGRRQWFIQQVAGDVFAERSATGTSPHVRAGAPGILFLANTCGTIVRCCTHEREVTFPRRGQMRVAMPKYHLWPWMMDTRSRLKNMTPEKWRWHLVQELNARVLSATLAREDFPVDDLPAWARKMLTVDEIVRLTRNQELLR